MYTHVMYIFLYYETYTYKYHIYMTCVKIHKIFLSAIPNAASDG